MRGFTRDQKEASDTADRRSGSSEFHTEGTAVEKAARLISSARYESTASINNVSCHSIYATVTALIKCGVCVPSNYTGFYIKCNLLRNKEK